MIENTLEPTADINLTVSMSPDLDTLSLAASASSKSSEFRLSNYGTAFVTISGVTAKEFKSTKTKTAGSYRYVYTKKSNVDAEKGTQRVYTYLCWAAAASNMYVNAGWNTSGRITFNTEDNVLKYFTQYVVKDREGYASGGITDAGLVWLFYGPRKTRTVHYFPVSDGNSGKLHSEVDINEAMGVFCNLLNGSLDYCVGDYFSGITKADAWGYRSMQVVDEYLRQGYSAGLSFGFYACNDNMIFGNREGGHAVTITGFTYDKSKEGTPGYYTGVILADSDDDISGTPEKASNRLKIVSLTWSPELKTYYFSEKTQCSAYTTTKRNSYYSTQYSFLEHFVLLAPASSQTSSLAGSLSIEDELFAAEEPYAAETDMAEEAADPLYDAVVADGETLDVSGRQAYSTQVQSGGELIAGTGAVLQNTSVAKDGLIVMSGNAQAKDTAVSGELILNDASSAEDTDIWECGIQRVLGGQATKNTFHTASTSQIVDGESSYAEDNTFYGGSQTVSDYAETSGNLFVHGSQLVTTGGCAYETKLTEGATQTVTDNGIAYDTYVGSGCVVDVQAEGIIDNIIVENGGTVQSAGILCSVTLEYGSRMILEEGAYLLDGVNAAGTITANGKVQGALEGITGETASLVFDLSSRSFDDDFIVNDLSKFENMYFDVSLKDLKQWGTYKLAAAGADSVDSVLFSVDTGEFYEQLFVGESISSGRYTATLSSDEDQALYISIDNVYAKELEKTTVSGNGAKLYSAEQQFSGGDWDDKGNESCVLQLEYDGLYQIAGDFGTMNGSITVRGNNNKKIGSGKIKNGVVNIKPLLLNKETEYTVIVSDNGKGVSSPDYTLGVSGVNVFNQACTLDDWDDLKTKGSDGSIFYCDTIVESGELFRDWVGYGDVIDYTEFSLETSTRISFDLTAGDKVRFSIYELKNKTDSKGNVSYYLKNLQNTNLKAGETKTTKALLLTEGIYYMAMKSTNATKGGDADYYVGVNENTVFYSQGDNTDDTINLARLNQMFPWENGETILDWVGYGDAIDYFKLSMEEDGKLELALDDITADAVKNRQLKLSCFDADGKKVTLGALDTTADTVTSKKIMAAGEYYLGVACSNEKKYDTAYEITLNMLA